MGEKPKVTASTTIAASPEKVFGLVSDLTRMGEWSPEATGGRWVGGTGPAPGVKFKGKNQHGSKTWSSMATVTEASAPTRFAFATKVGPIVVSEWAYDIAPDGEGCTVTESWVLRQPGLIGAVGKMLTGVEDRVTYTKSTMETTLAKLKETAESR